MCFYVYVKYVLLQIQLQRMDFFAYFDKLKAFNNVYLRLAYTTTFLQNTHSTVQNTWNVHKKWHESTGRLV